MFLDGLKQLLFPFLWLIDFAVEGRRERQYPLFSVILRGLNLKLCATVHNCSGLKGLNSCAMCVSRGSRGSRTQHSGPRPRNPPSNRETEYEY